MSKKRSSVFQDKINKDDTAELAETVMTKKGRQVFQKKIETPSDATDNWIIRRSCLSKLKYVSVGRSPQPHPIRSSSNVGLHVRRTD